MTGRRTSLALFACAAVVAAATAAVAQGTGQTPDAVRIRFFWGDGCPHCEEEKRWLEQVAAEYPQVRIEACEVWYDRQNRRLLRDVATAYGVEPTGVPVTFIGRRAWVGFTAANGREMEEAIRVCLAAPCAEPDRAPGVAPSAPAGAATQVPASLSVPFLGTVELTGRSLWVSTALIAFADGFNPCSLWVLSLLLAVVIRAGSRRRLLLVGSTFLVVTAAIYGLFIVGLFGMLEVVGYRPWIRASVALLALVFALVNIKDYFWYREGLSFTIPERAKPRIYRDLRSVWAADRSTLGVVGATALMAAGVTVIEFPCTAGFPVVWANLIAAQSVPAVAFLLLLVLYVAVYLLDELVVFGSAVVTLKASRFEETHGRVLKLAGGVLMLALALVLWAKPELMNELGGSLAVFGAAAMVTGVILVLHRRVLPRLGLHIGTPPRA